MKQAQPVQVTSHTAADTQAVAARLAPQLCAGDLILLTGDLGAGKTTFTKGLGRALNVQGAVVSPTFIMAREHPGAKFPDGQSGPALIHVDAYRLDTLDLDGLDLESSLDQAITVVEWGGGLQALSPDRLEIDIARPRGAFDADDPEAGPRQITITPVGPRWASAPLPDLEA